MSPRLCCIAALVLPLTTLRAQSRPSSVDASRSSIGISIGVIGGASLWSVGGQAISNGPPPHTDTVSLARTIPVALTLDINYTRFVSATIAIVADGSYLGLQTSDDCIITHDEGDQSITDVCGAFRGRTSGSGDVLALQGGALWRPDATRTLQPYLKGLVGISTDAYSTAAVTLGSGISNTDAYTVYTDAGWSSLRPVATIGGGISTGSMNGIQVHFEARESFLAFPAITGPNPLQGSAALTRNQVHGFWSIVAGLDLVLRRSRGRRY